MKKKSRYSLFGIIIIMSVMFLINSCADDKTFRFHSNEKQHIVKAEPYGWGNSEKNKIEGVKYSTCTGNVVWSIILSETIVVPIYLTGWELFEPYALDTTIYLNNKKINLIE